MDDYDRAIELVEQASPAQADGAGNPTLALVYCRRGDVRHDQFLDEEAEADFASARRCHPVAAAGYLGEMWLRRCNYTKAVDAFAQLVQCRPDDAQSYVGRGMAHEALGDLEDAAADYSEAIRKNPDADIAFALRAPGPPPARAALRRTG